MALVDNVWYNQGSNGLTSLVDFGTSVSSTGATITTGGVTVPAGALIVVIINEAGTTLAGSLSDGGTNTYTLAQGLTFNTNSRLQVYYKANATALNAATMTFTKGVSGDVCSMSVIYFTGIAAVTPLDAAVTATNTGTSLTPTVTSGTPSQSGTLVLAALGYTGTAAAMTQVAGWQSPPANSTSQATAQMGGGFYVSTSAQPLTYAPTLASSDAYGAIILGFKMATAPVGYWATTAWSASAAKTVGAIIRPKTPVAIGNERTYVAVASTSGTGTTNTTEPTWTFTRGVKITDNTVTWMECTGVAALNGDMSSNTPNWAKIKGTVVTQGQIIQSGDGTKILAATTGGTAGSGTEPTWAAYTTAGATTVDNTVTWTTLGASFSAWSAPHARLANAFASTWGQAGNTFWLADNHMELQGQGMTNTSPGASNTRCLIYSVDHTASVPPGTSALKAGAGFFVWNNSKITNQGWAYCYGATFNIGNVTGASLIVNWITDTCIINGQGHPINAGVTTGSCLTIFNNTVFNNTSLNPGGGKLIWKNTPTTLGGVTNNPSFASGATGSSIIIDGVDLSAQTGTIIGNTGLLYVTFVNCKLGAGVVFTNPSQEGGHYIDVIDCDSGATSYRQERYWYEGTLTQSTGIVRTGGASDGTTALSHNVVTTANSTWVSPFESFPLAILNTVTATNRVVTVYGIVNAAAVPNTDDVWIEVEYFGSASSPLASIATTTKANNLATGSALTADTSAWDSQVTARVNGTTYVVGQAIKTASNSGRVFFCTTGGAAAGSEPVGYASAVDGGSVTDGAAVFRAGCRFSMAVTLSAPQPAMAGYLRAFPKFAKPSTTFLIDPKPVLS